MCINYSQSFYLLFFLENKYMLLFSKLELSVWTILGFGHWNQFLKSVLDLNFYKISFKFFIQKKFVFHICFFIFIFLYIFIFFYFFFFFFCFFFIILIFFFEGSNWSCSRSLSHSCGNTGSKPHLRPSPGSLTYWVRPGLEPASSQRQC